MGRYVAKINKTYVEYGDWNWDYIKNNKPKEYYDKAAIDATIDEDGEKKEIKIPVNKLVDIKLVKTNYTWEWNDKKTLHKWLFDYLRKKGEKIEGYVYVNLHTGCLDYDKPLVEGYYLQSEIGDENIVLSTKKKIHEIKNYDDYKWLRLRFLSITK